MAKPLLYPRFKAFTDTNAPAVGWKVRAYLQGTSTPATTYSDVTLATPNPAPVILDGSGEADIWLDPAVNYKITLSDASDVVQRTVDGIQADEDGVFADLIVSGDGAITGNLAVAGGVACNSLTVVSTAKVTGLNADQLDGADWAAPAAIGSTTPAAGSFTTLSASGASDVVGNSTVHGQRIIQGVTGEQWIQGAVSEEITLSTSGTTTDSVANLLPANSIIEAVSARITQAITTATDWKMGDATQGGRFMGAIATLVLGTTAVGLAHRDPTVATANLGPVQSAAAKLRITTTGTPGAGKIRVTVYYSQFIPPTS
jgi:hypothetical protein